MSCDTQRPNACKSCPWLDNDLGYCFSPSALEPTIVADLAAERLQGCHSNQRNFCTGYLSFVKYRLDYGLQGLHLARIAIVLKLLNPDIVPKLNTFESVEMMLQYHRRLSRHSPKISSTD